MDDGKALPVTVLLVGCGVRGHNYTTYALAHPDRLKVINLQFEGGATATHTVVAFSEANGTRETRIFVRMGELRCVFGGPVELYDFRTGKKTIHVPPEPIDAVPEPLKHYWCSDYNTIHGYVSALWKNDPSYNKTGTEVSLASHKMSFIANRAKKERNVLNL